MFDAVSVSKKRSRGDDDENRSFERPSEKKARQTAQSIGESWFPHDSVLGTPTASSQTREPLKYNSDDEQSSSVVSEPGSPQDVSMDSDDEGMGMTALSQSPEALKPQIASSSPWGQRIQQTNRVPTPMMPMRLRNGVKQHVRQRHPQEINSNSSDLLEVPSPIEENDFPTPPSAAEVAGSQLSMLSVSDVEMGESGSIPTIAIDPVRTPNPSHGDMDEDFIDGAGEHVVVRRQRQRSGALSNGNGNNGTGPARAGPSTTGSKRGFSIGWRPDCEKCQMRVPGHFNHWTNGNP
ncbi:uncharacterized protein RCC_02172 [Ramularia collo-cygni]|uniref:Uncharacterized protein n=1 Tax=Ramularia collo-cygni TaxID=112498 RepID=A0A2D3UTX8_9PEZI|nr:uncharacterized protein RCC_02172 [Ramularia collo-cygni]CZT16330.1 uncharacterized protein RCC_02172 [Ramularia collo-cygni]